ncbi:MAG: molybdopterin molybdotransferase MoeA [Akkermansiaceae bacterium]|jgi:molybdopterin molybdotransferase
MPLITPQEAEAVILEATEVLGTEFVTLKNALGRVLREDLFADRPFPPFDRVTMDGVAFRFTDFSGAPLPLQGLHAAGDPTPAPLKNGHCWQVMTGSVMPPDCDTVVPYEEVTMSEETGVIQINPEPGKFIHREGSDAQKGDLILKSGIRIGPGHLGIAASIGAVILAVTKQARITILTTGDELIPPDEIPLPHQLRQTNGITLEAAIHQWGPALVTRHHLADDLAATTRGIALALENSDLVILSGGISKGKKDYVRPALEELRGEPLFHGVAQRPGKPLAFWPGIAALPGNPNSTLTTFHRYLVPLLHRMTGAPQTSSIQLDLHSPIEAHPSLSMMFPALINSDGTLKILTPQNSGDFLSALSGTGYVEIPAGVGLVTRAEFRSSIH